MNAILDWCVHPVCPYLPSPTAVTSSPTPVKTSLDFPSWLKFQDMHAALFEVKLMLFQSCEPLTHTKNKFPTQVRCSLAGKKRDNRSLGERQPIKEKILIGVVYVFPERKITTLFLPLTSPSLDSSPCYALSSGNTTSLFKFQIAR